MTYLPRCMRFSEHYVFAMLSCGVFLLTNCSNSTFSSGAPGTKQNQTVSKASTEDQNANEAGTGTSVDSSDTSPDTSSDTSSHTASSTSTSVDTNTVTTCDVDQYNYTGLAVVPPDVTEIRNASELASITDLRRYKIVSDITLTGTWVPLNAKRFYLDGGGHTISGLTVNVPDGNGTTSYHNAAGLFAHLDGAAIVNLKIAAPTVSARFNAGTIAGSMNRSCVENIVITGANINATYQAGVIAGSSDRGLVSFHKVTAQVTLLEGPNAQSERWSIGAAGSIGGVIGEILNGGAGPSRIEQTVLTFDLSADTPIGTSGIGAFVGTSQDDKLLIKDSTATGTMRCLSPVCYRGGRFTGFISSSGTPLPRRDHATVNLTKVGTWDQFQDQP